MPRVSVLMPVYNTNESYLREAIESILNQTYKDFEFLILDDGSTNNVSEVVKSYTDERIKYFYHENQGLSATLNWGFDLAQGEFIARMDSDDISLPQRFAKQVKFLEENKDVSLIGTWFEVFPDKRVVQPPVNINYLDLVKSNCICHPSVMYRRADFVKFGLRYDSSFDDAEDFELWSRAVLYLKMQNLPEVLLKYRWHTTNVSVLKTGYQSDKGQRILRKMLNFLSDDVRLQAIITNAFSSYKISAKLFGFIPLVKVKKNADMTHIILLGCIPLLNIKMSASAKMYYFLKFLPILKIGRK